MTILIENAVILPMTGPENVIENGYITIEGERITEVGAGKPTPGAYAKIIDGTNKAVMPGFINTHTHAAMTLLRGYADDLPLQEWLQTKIWPLEAKFNAEHIYWGTMLAIAEMIKSGTTTFADMYFFMDEVARAVEETGVRGVLARGLTSGRGSDKSVEENLALHKKWHGKAQGRISVFLGPHAPYTCSADFLHYLSELAQKEQIGIHIHLAETKKECDDIMKQHGKTPIALAEEAGLFKNKVIAAHCVYVTEEDIKTLKKYGVGVAHNPESNMKLSSGVAPVPAMLEAGIKVGLGTDGASSNNNLDMLQETRSAALLHKVSTMKPTSLPAYQALEMATANGAAVIGQEKEIGRLVPGYKADLIILDLDVPHMTPCYDIYANIVYSAQASDVLTVMVNGGILMENRVIKTFDEKKLLAHFRKIARDLLAG
ncbi:MAG: amidohydrolase [Syntrophomonadaceae bacterium]|nr:amidohydrolase [Syntrophomonadaceae bacterium]